MGVLLRRDNTAALLGESHYSVGGNGTSSSGGVDGGGGGGFGCNGDIGGVRCQPAP